MRQLLISPGIVDQNICVDEHKRNTRNILRHNAHNVHDYLFFQNCQWLSSPPCLRPPLNLCVRKWVFSRCNTLTLYTLKFSIIDMTITGRGQIIEHLNSAFCWTLDIALYKNHAKCFSLFSMDWLARRKNRCSAPVFRRAYLTIVGYCSTAVGSDERNDLISSFGTLPLPCPSPSQIVHCGTGHVIWQL